MGEIEVEGPGSLAYLQRLVSNDVSKIAIGGAQYSVLLNEEAGVIDDLFVYRLANDRYLVITNAGNHEIGLEQFGRLAPDLTPVRTTRCSLFRGRTPVRSSRISFTSNFPREWVCSPSR